MFFGRTDAKAETPVLWPPHVKGWLIGKDPDAGRDWGQEEKGTTEDEMAGWHNRLDGCEFEWTPGVWWTGRPGMLQFMGSQRVGHNWVTELNWNMCHFIFTWFWMSHVVFVRFLMSFHCIQRTPSVLCPSIVLCWIIAYVQLRITYTLLSLVSLSYSISLVMFCLVFLTIIDSEVFKSVSTIDELSIFAFISNSFCFMYFDVLFATLCLYDCYIFLIIGPVSHYKACLFITNTFFWLWNFCLI